MKVWKREDGCWISLARPFRGTLVWRRGGLEVVKERVGVPRGWRCGGEDVEDMLKKVTRGTV